MKETDNITMTIKIGEERMKINIPFSRQQLARDAEKAANGLVADFRHKFPQASDAAILARVTFGMSTRLIELSDLNDDALLLAQNADKSLSDLLETEKELNAL